jgi:hypothetical protein
MKLDVYILTIRDLYDTAGQAKGGRTPVCSIELPDGVCEVSDAEIDRLRAEYGLAGNQVFHFEKVGELGPDGYLRRKERRAA